MAIALILAAPPTVTAQDSVLVYTDSTCILEPAVEEGSCPDLATLDSQYGIRFARYVPPAGSPGYRDLQYSGNPSIRVRFELGEAGKVRLSVYDVRGQLVRRLADHEEAEQCIDR